LFDELFLFDEKDNDENDRSRDKYESDDDNSRILCEFSVSVTNARGKKTKNNALIRTF